MATPVYPPKTDPTAIRADAEWAALHPSANQNTSDPNRVTASSQTGNSSSVVSVNVEAPDLTGLSQVGQGIVNAQAGFDHFRDVLKDTFAVPNLIDFFGGVVGFWIIIAALVLLTAETEVGQQVIQQGSKAVGTAAKAAML